MLASIASQTRSPREVLVADGGSQDGTAELAAASGATVIRCPRAGRGDQIAYALAKAQSAAVLVAHADMQLSENAIATIEKWLSRNPDSPGGCLGHRFA
ncbi:MAG TPA: glycosyltransferase, partial [Planctomycetia bacterium]|nr:glycosyltransferase [Planctomycetia bacterium]